MFISVGENVQQSDLVHKPLPSGSGKGGGGGGSSAWLVEGAAGLTLLLTHSTPESLGFPDVQTGYGKLISKGRWDACLRRARLCGDREALLAPVWGLLRPVWGLLGPVWALLGPAWGLLSPVWALLGLVWALTAVVDRELGECRDVWRVHS